MMLVCVEYDGKCYQKLTCFYLEYFVAAAQLTRLENIFCRIPCFFMVLANMTPFLVLANSITRR